VSTSRCTSHHAVLHLEPHRWRPDRHDTMDGSEPASHAG
jgi:hypothetical protein